MSNDQQPPTDKERGASPSGRGRARSIEQLFLDSSAQATRNLSRDASQRHLLRWLAVGITFAVIVLMVVLLCGAYWLFAQTAPLRESATATYVVASLIVPIVLITSLTIALLVAAFHGFKGTDGEGAIKTTTDAVRGLVDA